MSVVDREEDECEIKVGQRLDVADHGEWLCKGPIGCGGMGWVLEVVALHKGAAGKVRAVKVMHRKYRPRADLLERFSREVAATITIEHDNVLPVDGLFWTTNTDPRIPLIFMERLRGKTLRQMMNDATENGETFPLQFICSIAHNVCEGFKEIHPRALVHRDIKPENIFLHERGGGGYRVVIMDFGIVKERAFQNRLLSEQGLFIGTDAYSSPEQFRGEEVTEQSDLYSFGVVLYEMFAMRPIFPGLRGKDLKNAHEKQSPTRLREVAPHVPPRLEQMIMAALEKDPGKRPPTAAVFSEPFTYAFLKTAQTAGNSTVERALATTNPDPAPARPGFASLPQNTVRLTHFPVQAAVPSVVPTTAPCAPPEAFAIAASRPGTQPTAGAPAVLVTPTDVRAHSNIAAAAEPVGTTGFAPDTLARSPLVATDVRSANTAPTPPARSQSSSDQPSAITSGTSPGTGQAPPLSFAAWGDLGTAASQEEPSAAMPSASLAAAKVASALAADASTESPAKRLAFLPATAPPIHDLTPRSASTTDPTARPSRRSASGANPSEFGSSVPPLSGGLALRRGTIVGALSLVVLVAAAFTASTHLDWFRATRSAASGSSTAASNDRPAQVLAPTTVDSAAAPVVPPSVVSVPALPPKTAGSGSDQAPAPAADIATANLSPVQSVPQAATQKPKTPTRAPSAKPPQPDAKTPSKAHQPYDDLNTTISH